MNRKKEVAKFFAGAAAWETLGHLLMPFSGLLPLRVFGFTYTQTMNTVQIIVAAIISLLLVYSAWIKNASPKNAP
ncbi:MAG TPA: hypothetical protein VK846_11365 [Candidatus Limnocylindria bacterium]|nr:hypothetical protein [Candidatus Limnocylindria bacterium]